MTPRRSSHLDALCIRTRVIGTGNSFGVLIPLSHIDPEGQTYRVIVDNKPYVPFELGITPYVGGINLMPQGWDRYEAYKVHERAAKARQLVILQHAFPESHLTALPTLWNGHYLADKEMTLRINRDGSLAAPGAQQRLVMELVL